MCVEPELSPGVHLKNTRAAPIIFLYFVKKNKKNKPLAAFPPSVRLKEHQTKQTSLIPTERLQYKKTLGRIFGAATPPGALVKILSRISVGGISMVLSLLSLSLSSCSGRMARWTLPHEQPCYMLFYFTWRYRALLRSFTVQGRCIGPETRALLAATLWCHGSQRIMSQNRVRWRAASSERSRCM